MKKYRIIYCALGALLSMGVASCSLTEEPDSYYEKDTFFNSESKAKLAVIGVYDCLAVEGHYGQREMAMPASDDTYYIQGTGTDNTRRDIAHYMVKSTNTWVADVWDDKYQGIDRANFVIAGIEGMPEYEGNQNLHSMVAEAKFLRAFMAFDLIKYWGDVPFKRTYTGGYEDAFQARVSREQIYDYIIEDLNFAKENLPAVGTTTSPEVPDQVAAHALLMRVYLQRAGYSLQMDGKMTRPSDDLRKQYFEAVIDEWEEIQRKGGHRFYDGGYTELFKTYSACVLNNQESLWEIAFNPTGSSFKDNAGYWATYNGPLVDAPGCKPTENTKFMGRANAFFRVLPCWKSFFEENDERRDVMVVDYQLKWDKTLYNHVKKSKADDPANWYPGKWRREWMELGFIDPNLTGVNYCPLRYADAVLMAAEAYNETNNTSEAWNLLNQVRERAGATPVSSLQEYRQVQPNLYDLPFFNGGGADDFRTALYWERGFELAFEGQRKYDLIRWGILGDALAFFQSKMDPKLKGKYVAGDKFVKGKHELFPIPLGEIQANPALEGRNNPGYE